MLYKLIEYFLSYLENIEFVSMILCYVNNKDIHSKF